MHAAHACFLGQAHDPIEVFMQQRITRAAEREDTIAVRSDLREDAPGQIERQRLSAGCCTHRAAEYSATRSRAAQLEDDMLRQLVPRAELLLGDGVDEIGWTSISIVVAQLHRRPQPPAATRAVERSADA